MKSRTSKSGKQPKSKYPFIGFRPSTQLRERIEALKEKSDGELGLSDIVRKCVNNHLPVLEKGK